MNQEHPRHMAGSLADIPMRPPDSGSLGSSSPNDRDLWALSVDKTPSLAGEPKGLPAMPASLSGDTEMRVDVR